MLTSIPSYYGLISVVSSTPLSVADLDPRLMGDGVRIPPGLLNVPHSEGTVLYLRHWTDCSDEGEKHYALVLEVPEQLSKEIEAIRRQELYREVLEVGDTAQRRTARARPISAWVGKLKDGTWASIPEEWHQDRVVNTIQRMAETVD